MILAVKDPAFVLDAPLLRRMVRDGGATLRAIRMEGIGKLTEGKEGWIWELCGSGQRLSGSLVEGLPRPDGKDCAVTGETEIPEGEKPFEPKISITAVRVLPVKAPEGSSP